MQSSFHILKTFSIRWKKNVGFPKGSALVHLGIRAATPAELRFGLMNVDIHTGNPNTDSGALLQDLQDRCITPIITGTLGFLPLSPPSGCGPKMP